mmetsp:Transcript_16964/g.44915  ORF Transcript_16964/g.44915 Transcript_16964/m.44915 type:complete len:252 (-) Transcript_16964:333-1088(-)
MISFGLLRSQSRSLSTAASSSSLSCSLPSGVAPPAPAIAAKAFPNASGCSKMIFLSSGSFSSISLNLGSLWAMFWITCGLSPRSCMIFLNSGLSVPGPCCPAVDFSSCRATASTAGAAAGPKLPPRRSAFLLCAGSEAASPSKSSRSSLACSLPQNSRSSGSSSSSASAQSWLKPFGLHLALVLLRNPRAMSGQAVDPHSWAARRRAVWTGCSASLLYDGNALEIQWSLCAKPVPLLPRCSPSILCTRTWQ